MINVNDDHWLYVPLYYYKPNNEIIRFTVEDCKFDKDGKTVYYFPLEGRHEHFFHFLKWCSVNKDILDEHNLSDVGRWNEFVKLMKDDGTMDSFNILCLQKQALKNILIGENDTLIKRPRIGIKNTVHVRAGLSIAEMYFYGAYSVLNDIPKSIDIAMKLSGNPSLEGNFAIVDLKKMVETGEMVYKIAER